MLRRDVWNQLLMYICQKLARSFRNKKGELQLATSGYKPISLRRRFPDRMMAVSATSQVSNCKSSNQFLVILYGGQCQSLIGMYCSFLYSCLRSGGAITRLDWWPLLLCQCGKILGIRTEFKIGGHRNPSRSRMVVKNIRNELEFKKLR